VIVCLAGRLQMRDESGQKFQPAHDSNVQSPVTPAVSGVAFVKTNVRDSRAENLVPLSLKNF